MRRTRAPEALARAARQRHAAARAVIRYGFDVLKSEGLFAGHNPANEPSRRLLMKLGFRYTHEQYYAPTGLKHLSYLLTAEEYACGKENGDA